jgi:hypothetical protein
MARDDDDYRERKRRRDEEDDKEREKELLGRTDGVIRKSDLSGVSSEKVDELILRAEPMIDQIQGLYNQYLSGIEKHPPNERRKQLEQLMYTLQLVSKPTAGLQFRYQTLNAKYVSYRERWDKVLKDLEDGKIKRRIAGSGGRTV